MRREYLTGLYDDEYAASYEEKFLLSELTRSDTAHELTVLAGLLETASSWLDVACGTGFFLRHFPDVDRAGIDIAPAMLRRARDGNQGVPLVLHDFRDPLPAWQGRFEVVSCMWYAYGLVDTIEELLKLVHNLWSWTAATGVCFVPLADPRLMTGVQLPYRVPYDERSHLEITGIVWSYVEEDGRKTHLHQFAPNTEFMVEQFEVYFEEVELVRYPPAFPGWQGRPALIARRKRSPG